MNLVFPSMDKLIVLHNEYREKSWWRLKPLVKDGKLMNYAEYWASYMSQNQKMYHSKIKNIIRLGFSRAGENIAYGQMNEEKVMSTWMNSAGHRANILSSSFTKIGCGFSYSDDDILYWCVCFGKPKDRS